MFVRNHAVDIEIFFARPDVEPIPVIQRNAADPSALVNPIRNDWNKRNLFVRRNPLENRRVPNRDICKIKISLDAVAVADVYDTVIAQSYS